MMSSLGAGAELHPFCMDGWRLMDGVCYCNFISRVGLYEFPLGTLEGHLVANQPGLTRSTSFL